MKPQQREAILRLREEERLTERDIARRLEIPPSTVHYWLAKAFVPPREAVRLGRPRVTTPALDGALVARSLADPFASAVDLRADLAPEVSVDTVRKRLKERGLRCRVPARKPFLGLDHLDKRLRFAQRYCTWGVEQWEQVVFSDEKVFRASSRGALRLYRPQKSDRYDQRYLVPSSNPKGKFTINVWMAFGKSFRSLVRIERATLNSEYYIQNVLPTIEQHLVDNDLLFMQDLSSVHTSHNTRLWLQMHNIDVMDDWPPKGPDMNPVENVWAELVRRTRNDATNRTQLWENVHASFRGLEEAYFDKLLESMPRRLEKVIAADGGWTKY